ncbi:glycosyltransferase [Candidatus Halobonum tyrrellensis]|uniref:Glycosyl transferase family 2 n=1 Tax=Candidatus Halobonum tyrrellensis G22 TaxID=1324957 RepID=V4HFZ0_9EURY|nr:glycosyltransferase [Candidatus Halobonum tyrrellensis]ESP89028.1 glycosyl transferase family 2 [Candidatus Halobonum tyrrellensis G22]
MNLRPRRLLSWLAGLVSVTGLPYLLFVGLYLRRSPEGSPADKVYGTEPSVSVVLPTYDEERIVESKLEAVCGWDYPMERVEVVVVDSSDDRTPDIVESFFADREAPSLTLIREPERRGLAVALNEAYAAAENEVVVKTDCDSRVADDALREAVANLEDPAVGGVTGRNAEVLGGSEVERGYRDVQAEIQTLESHLDSTFIFHGPFSAFDADAVVPIDDDSIADDTELALRVRKGGDRVLFDPEIRYKEASHSEFSKRHGQKDRRAMGLLRVLWRQRGMLGGYGAYGRVVLPFNWWFMVVSPALVTAGVGVATLAGLALAGPFGLAVPAALAGFVRLGGRDALGPLQPAYSLFDTQVSLARAAVSLLRGEGDGTWEVDAELREAFE